jgi:hypothetical protein
MQMNSEISAEKMENCGTFPLFICDLYLLYMLSEIVVNNIIEKNIMPIRTLSAVLYVFGVAGLATSFAISAANAAIPAKINEYPTIIGTPTLEGSMNAAIPSTVAPHPTSA